MKKYLTTVVILILVLSLSGCSGLFKVKSAFHGTTWNGGSNGQYTQSGLAKLENGKDVVIFYIQAEQAVSIELTGSLTRKSGDAELVLTLPDGTSETLLDTQGLEASPIPVELSLEVPEGLSSLRLEGEEAAMEFDLLYDFVTDGPIPAMDTSIPD